MKEKIAVITGNEVQSRLSVILQSKGFDCKTVDNISIFKENPFGNCGKVILPFPSKTEKIKLTEGGKRLSDFITAKQTVTGGLLSEEIKEDLETHAIKYNDYFTEESYVLKNAFVTSQGVLRLLLENTKAFLPGKKVLITGFGRIGKSLAVMLKALGMKVFIAARSKTALCEASSMGFEVFRISHISATLFYYDFIINTVPDEIFSQKDISFIRNDAVYFEAASSPFGADKVFFEEENKAYVDAGALPGRFYPAAVAENIADYILSQGGD